MSKKMSVSQNREKIDPFSIAFLDIISCGFGAVVVLILIFRFDPFEKIELAPLPQEDTSAAFTNLLAEARLTQQTKEAKITLNRLTAKEKNQIVVQHELERTLVELRQAIASEQAIRRQKQQKIQSLTREIERVKIAGAKTSAPSKTDEEVGGIIVDRDYVVFIVDTSGSMLEIWGRVAARMTQILSQHPKVKGFQIMNDNGNYLVSSYEKRWISDTPKMRSHILKLFKLWRSTSNSSPTEGLVRALTDFKSQTGNMSIYVLGDDYSGSDFDGVIDKVRLLNRGGARINAINFISRRASTERFSILMREIALDNQGTLITL